VWLLLLGEALLAQAVIRKAALERRCCGGDVAQEDVACGVKIAARHELAPGTLENAVAAELGVLKATLATGLAGVGLTDEYHAAPGILACLADQALAEAVVSPREHVARCLALDAPPTSLDHLADLKLGQQHHGVLAAEPLGQALVRIVDEVADAQQDPASSSSHAPPLVMLDLSPFGLQSIVAKCQSINALHVSASPLDCSSTWVVTRHEGAHAWIQCYDTLCRRALALGPNGKRFQQAQVVVVQSRALQSHIIVELGRQRLGRLDAMEGIIIEASLRTPVFVVDDDALAGCLLAAVLDLKVLGYWLGKVGAVHLEQDAPVS